LYGNIGASDYERGFFRSLSQKNGAIAEAFTAEGVPIAGRIAGYTLPLNELEQYKIDTQARLKAIDYEILRREKEPRMEALKFVILHFKEAEGDLAKPETQSEDEF